MFRRKREKESVDLEALFKDADWPTMHDVTMHLSNGDMATLNGISGIMLDSVENSVSAGVGVITVQMPNGDSTVIPSREVVYYTSKPKEMTMWNEDKL